MTARKAPAINLLPQDRFEYSRLGRFLSWALSTGRYLVIASELVVIVAFLARFWLDRTLIDLRELRLQKEAIVDSYSGIYSDFLAVQARLNAVAKLLAPHKLTADQLLKLKSHSPVGVEYDRIAVTGPAMVMRGYVPSTLVFSDLLTRFQSDASLSVTVKVLQISQKRSPGLDFEFEIVQKSEDGEISSR